MYIDESIKINAYIPHYIMEHVELLKYAYDKKERNLFDRTLFRAEHTFGMYYRANVISENIYHLLMKKYGIDS